MCLSIDHQAAHAADTFPAVMIKRDWLFALSDQLLIQYVQHLKERHVCADTVETIVAEGTGLIWSCLSPDPQSQIQKVTAHGYL
jgi:hypothetical protein